MATTGDQKTKVEEVQGQDLSKDNEEVQFSPNFQVSNNVQSVSYPQTVIATGSDQTPQYGNFYPTHNTAGAFYNTQIDSWSAGNPISLLGNYSATMENYQLNGNMFSPGAFGNTVPAYGTNTNFGWDFSNNFGGWNNTEQVRKMNYDYYRGAGDGHRAMVSEQPAYYHQVNGDSESDNVAGLEQGVQNMSFQRDDYNQYGNDRRKSGSAKSKTWASIASQPAKSQQAAKPKALVRTPALPQKQEGFNAFDRSSRAFGQNNTQKVMPQVGVRVAAVKPYAHSTDDQANNGLSDSGEQSAPIHPVLESLQEKHKYNPTTFDMNLKGCRFFVIKSYSEDDIHRSIKYSIWCSTEHGNKRLDAAIRERSGKGPVYLLYSVNGSGHFCGVAEMMSPIDYTQSATVWAQSKWKGRFDVKWIYVKDVPNSLLRGIRLENNENKPVTNSRDTQEVPCEKGKQVLKIIHNFKYQTSIFDDFGHYEKKQEEEGNLSTARVDGYERKYSKFQSGE